jgi:hypothetical protein
LSWCSYFVKVCRDTNPDLLFLLNEAQPKNALVTPSPQFGNKCKHLRECARCYIIYNFTVSLSIILHFFLFYSALVYNLTFFYNFTILLLSSFAQPQSKCLLFFIPYFKSHKQCILSQFTQQHSYVFPKNLHTSFRDSNSALLFLGRMWWPFAEKVYFIRLIVCFLKID